MSNIRLAVQEHLLPGDNLLSRLRQAQRMHIEGIEVSFTGLSERMTTLMSALEETRLTVSAVDVGGVHLLHPDYDMREQAIITLREAMTLAVDLGASGVIFMPQTNQTPRLPDLHPYKSTVELEAELLVTMLRTTLCDFANAFGIELYLMVGNRYITHLLQKLAHGGRILDDNKNHPMLKIGANTFNMGMEESDIIESLTANLDKVGYMQIAYRRHPSDPNPPELESVEDSLAFALDTETLTIMQTLHRQRYNGWVTLAGSMKRDSDIVKYASLLENYLTAPASDED
ncbi:MAG: sugar phosphate isomerase/epimerase [Anaerolineae bacterium]|jgi:sugar phosphate isomerase/epimerase|nr:sugar phosphate isomerase/epimerase [Anaerolineae bacterium]